MLYIIYVKKVFQNKEKKEFFHTHPPLTPSSPPSFSPPGSPSSTPFSLISPPSPSYLLLLEKNKGETLDYINYSVFTLTTTKGPVLVLVKEGRTSRPPTHSDSEPETHNK